MTTRLAEISATELLRLYRSGAASPVEATREVLARIEKLNPQLNAFCLVDGESALQSSISSGTAVPQCENFDSKSREIDFVNHRARTPSAQSARSQGHFAFFRSRQSFLPRHRPLTYALAVPVGPWGVWP